MLITRNVYPSGGDFATCSAPMVEPAPARLSMMICWPTASASFWLTMRPGISAAPPAEKGTTHRTGRFGYPCACTDDEMLNPIIAASNAVLGDQRRVATGFTV